MLCVNIAMVERLDAALYDGMANAAKSLGSTVVST
jgi:hypothetical protein